MSEKMSKISYGGEEYPVAFDINVMEIIQDEYGSIEEWKEQLSSGNAIKELKKFFHLAINEGIAIENDTLPEPRPSVDIGKVGRIIGSIKNAQKIMEEVIVNAVTIDDDDSKNESSTTATE